MYVCMYVCMYVHVSKSKCMHTHTISYPYLRMPRDTSQKAAIFSTFSQRRHTLIRGSLAMPTTTCDMGEDMVTWSGSNGVYLTHDDEG
jgi:hypothetical protein